MEKFNSMAPRRSTKRKHSEVKLQTVILFTLNNNSEVENEAQNTVKCCTFYEHTKKNIVRFNERLHFALFRSGK
jgi:hypothetical protein